MSNYFTEQNDRDEWLVYKSQRDGSSLLIIAFASRSDAQRCVKWLSTGQDLASFLNRNPSLEPNCLGVEILDSIVVELVLNGSVNDTIELQIQPQIIMHGGARTSELSPGAVYNPEFYTDHSLAFAGETIAYGINEGRAIDGHIDAYDDDPSIDWRVRDEDVVILSKHGIVEPRRTLANDTEVELVNEDFSIEWSGSFADFCASNKMEIDEIREIETALMDDGEFFGGGGSLAGFHLRMVQAERLWSQLRSFASVRSYYFGEAVFLRLAGLDDHKLALSDMRPLWRKADAQAREWMRAATNIFNPATKQWEQRQ